MKMKKAISLLLVVALTAVLSIGGTLAYLTKDAGTKVNKFQVGGIDVELTEEVDVITNGGGTFSPNQEGGADYIGLMPGDKITKKVTVTNTGADDVYVRVTVTLNNADLINTAIDEFYEGKGYTAEQVQEMYDEVFNGWGINYNPRPGAYDVNDARGVIDSTFGLPEHVMHVDFAKTTDVSNDTYMISVGNWFMSEQESADKYSGYYPAANGYYTAGMEDYEICYTYYIFLPVGEDTTLFEGLNIPAEFNADQLAMFDGLVIDVDADAIQAANIPGAYGSEEQAKNAFAILAGENVVEVETLEELETALEKGGKVILNADIAITPESTLKRGNYIAAIINDTTLDLNGHNISFDLGEEKASSSPRMFYVYSGTLNIVGEGNLNVTNDAAVCWVTSKGGALNIYGGNFVSDNHVTGSSDDIFAIVYSSGGEVHVYGGTFTYGNMSAGINGGFNVQDWWGHKITLHEGVLLSNEVYRQPQDSSAFRIRLAENCELKEVVIDGVTWYEVVPVVGVSDLEELEEALAGGKYIVLNSDITSEAGTTMVIPEGVVSVLDLNGHTLTNPVAGAPALENNGTLTLSNGTVVNGVSNQKGSVTIKNNGNLVVESGSYGTDSTAGAAIQNYGTAVINGGTFASKQEDTKADGLCAYVFINHEGTLTINEATVNCETHGLFAAYGGTVTVKGGNYTLQGNNGLGCYVVYATGEGKVELNNGTINTNKPRNNRVFFVYDGNTNYFNAEAVKTGKVVIGAAKIYLDGVEQNYATE